MGSFLGILTVVLIVLSMTRKGVKLFLVKAIARNKAKGLKMTLDIKVLLLLEKFHRYFGMSALLVAITHAALQFSQSGLPSATGGTLIMLLIAQGVSGYMQEKRLGNQKLVSSIHSILPPVMLVLIVLHIIYNSSLIDGLGILG
jgi:hypothetical protein